MAKHHKTAIAGLIIGIVIGAGIGISIIKKMRSPFQRLPVIEARIHQDIQILEKSR